MAITLVGVGAQNVALLLPAVIAVPSGVAAGDLLLMVIGARPSDPQGTNDSISITGSGTWAQHGALSYTATAETTELSVQFWYKIAVGSDADPTVTVGSSLTGLFSGWSGQIAAYRGVHNSTPFDVTAVVSGAGTAVQTFTPTGVTTVTDGAWAVSAVATSDDNALGFSVSQSFTADMSGSGYDTTMGGGHAVGLARKAIAAASAVTFPTWNQTVNGNDAWAAISTALRPAGEPEALAGTSAGGSSTAAAVGVALPLAGTSAGGSSTAAAVGVSGALEGPAGGAGTAEGALGVGLAGTSTGASTATGTLTVREFYARVTAARRPDTTTSARRRSST